MKGKMVRPGSYYGRLLHITSSCQLTNLTRPVRLSAFENVIGWVFVCCQQKATLCVHPQIGFSIASFRIVCFSVYFLMVWHRGRKHMQLLCRHSNGAPSRSKCSYTVVAPSFRMVSHTHIQSQALPLLSYNVYIIWPWFFQQRGLNEDSSGSKLEFRLDFQNFSLRNLILFQFFFFHFKKYESCVSKINLKV